MFLVFHDFLSVHCNFVVTCWRWAGLLNVFLCFCHFPMWCPWSGVVFGCIDSWSLHSYLLLGISYYFKHHLHKMITVTKVDIASNANSNSLPWSRHLLPSIVAISITMWFLKSNQQSAMLLSIKKSVIYSRQFCCTWSDVSCCLIWKY